MKFQFLVLVGSALLVDSLVKAGSLWTTYTECYTCNGYEEDCPESDTSAIRTKWCEAPRMYWAWCTKDITWDTSSGQAKAIVVRDCFSSTDNLVDHCEPGMYGSQECICYNNRCN